MNFLPTNLELLGRFLQCSGHSLSRTASSKTLGKPMENPVFGSIYIYRNICHFFVLTWPFTFWNVSGQKVLVEQHSKQEAWVKTTHQEKTNSGSLVKNDGEATCVIMLWVMVSHEATFLGAICKPLSRCWCCTLLPCRKLSLLESLAMGARNCGMSWEKIVKGLCNNHGAYRGATCSLLGTLFLAVCMCVLSPEFPRMYF